MSFSFPSLKALREHGPARAALPFPHRTFGEKLADCVAAVVGSWPFILVQAFLLLLWIVINFFAWIRAWDPYPFILLNLVLSFQAAFTAPVIMMSQNRQSRIDREKIEQDYAINLKAELEIEDLHTKIDLLLQHAEALSRHISRTGSQKG